MYIVKVLQIILWFLVIPYRIGSLFPSEKEGDSPFPFTNMAWGYVVMFAVFEVLSVPMILAWMPFHILKYSYMMICIVLALVPVIYRRKTFVSTAFTSIKEVRYIPFVMWAAVCLILLQMGAYVLGMATDLDDALYVAAATTTVHTDGLFSFDAYTGAAAEVLPYRYILSPFPMFLAFISEMISMHPAVTAHTIEPVFFLMISYTAYGMIGNRLFKKDKKAAGLFLAFVALVQMYSYYSVYSQGTFMTIRIWQGKALLAACILPMVFYQTHRCFTEETTKAEWWKLCLLSLSGCLLSTMGFMLPPILIGVMALLYCLPKRRIRELLYAIGCCIPCACCAILYIIMN